MPVNKSSLAFQRNFEPLTGECVILAPGIARICAPNASPYTFTGTNTYIVGNDEIVLIDPGPNDARHLQALLAALTGKKLVAIILTHTHRDHSALAPRLKELTGAPLWFAGQHRSSRPRKWWEINPLSHSCDWHLRPDRVLKDGDVLSFGEMSMTVIATPGHCANHICLGIRDTPFLLSGDHVMGWNTTLIAVPDGSMNDYFSSLKILLHMPWHHYLPAHGGPIEKAKPYTRALRAHRMLRNEQILSALNDGPATISQIAKKLYPQESGTILIAAKMTIKAHLEYLVSQEQVQLTLGFSGWRAKRLT